MRTSLLAAAVIAAFGSVAAIALPAGAEEDQVITKQDWPFEGMFGSYDMVRVKRGFEVYHQVCQNCHAMKLLSYRNLGGGDGAGTGGGMGLSDDDVAKIAAERKTTDGPNDAGDMFQRPGKPSDHFIPPFPNDNASRAANNGALPPDLSLIVKAREDGPNYVYSILTGFQDPPPAGVKLNPGMNYNKAFPGHQIAMPPPLADGTVTFADGTKATLAEEATDVVNYLNWAAEPNLDVRHNLGVKALIFAGLLTIVAYILKRKIWADVHH
jgi:ubiquinol-cytochrome c reductase cytochrome c1 subunit